MTEQVTPAADPAKLRVEEAPPPPPDDVSMSIWEHLAELRSRIVRMMLAFAVGFGVAWYFRKAVFHFVTVPYMLAWKAAGLPGEPSLVFLTPAAAFLAYVRLAAMSGLIFALPIILYQVWAFIAPGLYSKEKRFAVPFVLSSCGLFGLGGWFGWRFALPVALEFLIKIGAGGSTEGLSVNATLTISDYIEFLTHMLAAFGIAAELPVLVFFLTISGLVTHQHLIKFFRYFVVVAFVIAAVLTPPDPMSQLMLAVPLCMLYGVSIVIAYLFSRSRSKAA